MAMPRGYGVSTETAGLDLADERWEAPCPRWGESAEHGHIERAEGSINIYRTVACGHCWFHEGFDWLNP